MRNDAAPRGAIRATCGTIALRVELLPVSTQLSHSEIVAAEVRAVMARKRIRQSALVGPLGISQAGVSRRLSGAVEFTVTELDAVARVLEVPLASLLPQERLAS